MSPLPADLDAIARDELAPGEAVEWAAQPDAARAMRNGFATWFFAVPWTAFAVVWVVLASRGTTWTDLGAIFPLFGLPFILVGLRMLAAPLLAWRGARRTLYTVTDRRLILFESSGGRAITVRSLEPRALRDVRRMERPDGSGALEILSALRHAESSDTVHLINIPDVGAASDAIAFLAATHDWTAEERTADLMDDAVDDDVDAALGADRRRAWS